jgi:hypothetical protein
MQTLNVVVRSDTIQVGSHLVIQRNDSPLISQIEFAIRHIQTHGEPVAVSVSFENVLDAIPVAALQEALNRPLYTVTAVDGAVVAA